MIAHNSWGTKVNVWKVPVSRETMEPFPEWLLKAEKKGTILIHREMDKTVVGATLVCENGYQIVRPNEWIVEDYEDDYHKVSNDSFEKSFLTFG